jgi:Phage Mu protein F like protein
MPMDPQIPIRFQLSISEIRKWLKNYRLILQDEGALEEGKIVYDYVKLDKDQIDALVNHWQSMGGLNKKRTSIIIDPDIDEMFPYLQFAAIADGRSCDLCSNLNGKIINKKDPRVITFTPPLHIGCRCTFVTVNKYDIAAKNIKPNWPDDVQEPDWRIVTE